jgi:hypothetical protein
VTRQQTPPFPPTGGGPNPPNPTVQFPAVPKPPRARGRLLLATTLVIAVLGLVVGLAGVAVAAIALGRSDRAVSLAGAAHEQPAPAPTAATTTAVADPGPTDATDAANPDPSASPTEISPTAQFTVKYQGQHLRIRSPGCGLGDHTYVDLDEPRVTGGTDAATEFGYADCEPGRIETTLSFAQVAGPDATPSDCLETIRTDPGRSPIAPSTGLTLCFVTSQNDAAAQGISQKLVFVTMDSISRDDNTGVLNVTAKAWDVPQ